MLSGNNEKIKSDSLENKINAIDTTSGKLTGRGLADAHSPVKPG